MNLCTRCGKARIVSRIYTEKVDGAIVTHTVTICPNPECQKIVEKNLTIETARRKLLREEQEKRFKEQAQLRSRRKDISFGKND